LIFFFTQSKHVVREGMVSAFVCNIGLISFIMMTLIRLQLGSQVQLGVFVPFYL
jgi:hypothetical protein